MDLNVSLILLLDIATNVTPLRTCFDGVLFETLTAVLRKTGVLPGCDAASLGKWLQSFEGLQCLQVLELLPQQHSVTLLKTGALCPVFTAVDIVDNTHIHYEIYCIYLRPRPIKALVLVYIDGAR
jgi:hypothetical protein